MQKQNRKESVETEQTRYHTSLIIKGSVNRVVLPYLVVINSRIYTHVHSYIAKGIRNRLSQVTCFISVVPITNHVILSYPFTLMLMLNLSWKGMGVVLNVAWLSLTSDFLILR